ncbi:MAG: SPOR domain-containing protein [Deltaproteobacteria bacterium]|jgi:septal ring-binding cell division protein DamX|nr:SPOR domain-containing protein [Deltaproteobacteria bacterium]
MNVLLIIAGAACAVAACSFIYWRFFSTSKFPVAGGGKQRLYTRETGFVKQSFFPISERLITSKKGREGSSRLLGLLSLVAVIAILTGWLIVSLVIFKSDPQPQEASTEKALSEKQLKSVPAISYVKTINRELAPPPSLEELKAANEPIAQLPQKPSLIPAPFPPPAKIPPSPLPAAPGVFAPVEEGSYGNALGENQDYIALAAISVAPNNSRMSAAGRQAAGNTSGKILVTKESPEENRRLTAPLTQAPITVSAAAAVTGQKVDSATGSAGSLISTQTKIRKYTVLINSFTQPANAETFKKKLIGQGVPAVISEISINNKIWYRVMAGTFEDKSSAEAFVKELKLKNVSENPYVKPIM